LRYKRVDGGGGRVYSAGAMISSTARFVPLVFLVSLSLLLPVGAQPTEEERAGLFAVPLTQDLPFTVETLSEKESDGVVLSEIFLNGPPLAGKPTRIYGWYARPKEGAGLPGVVQLHGAGLDVLKPDAALEYARAGYVCLSIDWCGPAKGREKPRKPPYSEFEVSTGLAANGETGRHIGRFEDNYYVNGVRFVRRSFDYLRTRPEVDSNKLCLSGMSAGAYLTLLVLGVEPDIKAAAVKYGSGFIRQLNWGGYFSPICLAPPNESLAWLETLDPRIGLKNVKAATLMLSGTDDIFFWMPAVLATWRALPGPKHLWLRPNDNHQWVNNEEAPRAWFDSVLTGKPKWPGIGPIHGEVRDGRLELSVEASGEPKLVTFWYKTTKRGKFSPRHDKAAPEQKWESLEATLTGAVWTASLPVPATEDQLVVFANAESADGLIASSDTLEAPAFPAWRLPHERAPFELKKE